MAAQEYSVPIGVAPDTARLKTEIDGDATLAAGGKVVQGDVLFEQAGTGYSVRVTMNEALTDPTESDALAAVVAAHGGVYEPRALRIAALLPGGSLPPGVAVTQIDYKAGLLGRLHKVVVTRFRGEVRRVDYYLDATQADLVLAVEVFADQALTVPGYARTANGLAIERWTRRRWYNTDGSIGAEKTTHKRYAHDLVEQMVEGERRRRNVIRALTMDVLSMLIATTAADPQSPTAEEVAQAEADGSVFVEKYADEVSTYFRTGDVSWKGTPGVGNDSTPWLANDVTAFGWSGPTIRDEIQAALVEIYAP